MNTTYGFELTGITAAILHADDIEQNDLLRAYRTHPDNRKGGVAGDDRSPAWTWQTYLYRDGQHVAIPSDNIMTCLRTAGTAISLRGKKTYKQLTQSGMAILEDFCTFEGAKGQIPLKKLESIRNLDFAEQAEKVKSLGFRLFCKRAKIDKVKHVRVRPIFDQWCVRGQLCVFDESLSLPILSQLFEIAGDSVGLFDWRPSSPKSPGPYGRFAAKVFSLKG